jgi:hypothetical protein
MRRGGWTIVTDHELNAILRNRFLERAVDHPRLQVVLYVGRRAAFPEELLGDADVHAGATWVFARPSRLTPVHTDVTFHQEFTEVLAFFGETSSLEVFADLSRTAIDTFAPYQTPKGHELTEPKYPAAAWARWLFDSNSEKIERYWVTWHTKSAQRTVKTRLKDGGHTFDPVHDRVHPKAIALGCREWGCKASRFSVSPFIVSADIIAPRGPDGLAALEAATRLGGPLTNGNSPERPRLSVEISRRRAVVDGEEYEVEPHEAQMLNALINAKEDQEWWVTGPQMQDLPACKGKKPSRELQKLEAKIPALKDIIKHGGNKGYRLTE